MGDVYCIMSFYISSKPSYQANGSVAQRKRGCPGWGSPNFKATGLRG
jgi:hypothetical protein